MVLRRVATAAPAATAAAATAVAVPIPGFFAEDLVSATTKMSFSVWLPSGASGMTISSASSADVNEVLSKVSVSSVVFRGKEIASWSGAVPTT